VNSCKQGALYSPPTFHDSQLGLVHSEVYQFPKEHPTAKLDTVTRHLNYMFDRNCSRGTISTLLQKMGWSWKVPTVFQLLKYTFDNLVKYAHYLTEIRKVPLSKLKFADEAHFVYKDVTSQGKVLGLKKERVWLKQKTQFNTRGTLTILTSLDPTCPIIYDFTEDTNNQWTFTEFILDCCCKGELKQGDYFIVDNAPIHTGSGTAWLITEILDYFGVKLVYLPAYSPELNPCELVFSMVKTFIRNHHNDEELLLEVQRGLATVSAWNIYNFYIKCLYPTVILPELDLKQ